MPVEGLFTGMAKKAFKRTSPVARIARSDARGGRQVERFIIDLCDEIAGVSIRGRISGIGHGECNGSARKWATSRWPAVALASDRTAHGSALSQNDVVVAVPHVGLSQQQEIHHGWRRRRAGRPALACAPAFPENAGFRIPCGRPPRDLGRSRKLQLRKRHQRMEAGRERRFAGLAGFLSPRTCR